VPLVSISSLPTLAALASASPFVALASASPFVAFAPASPFVAFAPASPFAAFAPASPFVAFASASPFVAFASASPFVAFASASPFVALVPVSSIPALTPLAAIAPFALLVAVVPLVPLVALLAPSRGSFPALATAPRLAPFFALFALPVAIAPRAVLVLRRTLVRLRTLHRAPPPPPRLTLFVAARVGHLLAFVIAARGPLALLARVALLAVARVHAPPPAGSRRLLEPILGRAVVLVPLLVAPPLRGPSRLPLFPGLVADAPAPVSGRLIAAHLVARLVGPSAFGRRLLRRTPSPSSPTAAAGRGRRFFAPFRVRGHRAAARAAASRIAISFLVPLSRVAPAPGLVLCFFGRTSRAAAPRLFRVAVPSLARFGTAFAPPPAPWPVIVFGRVVQQIIVIVAFFDIVALFVHESILTVAGCATSRRSDAGRVERARPRGLAGRESGALAVMYWRIDAGLEPGSGRT